MKICCVVPVYNAERYLRESLDSILAQTVPPSRIIVVDDGSTDGTPRIVASYAGIDYIRQPQQGPSAARNLGIRESTEELVTSLDGDDLWLPDRLGRALDHFAADPDLGVQVCHTQKFTGAREPLGAPLPGYVASGMVARRGVFERVGGFAEDLPHGSMLDWFLKVRNAGLKMELIPDVLHWRRMHDQSMSVQGTKESLAEHLRVLRAQIAKR